MEILLFGGTTEGRMLAQWLDERGQRVTYCAATGYGGALAPEGAGITVRTGRLDRAGMAALLATGHFGCAVDATHPYAPLVSANLKAAAGAAGVPYLRLVREGPPEDEGWIHAPDAKTAAEMLLGMEGNILLTTGSKELDCYAVPGLRERVFPRVLPAPDSLNRCLELGFPPAHIISTLPGWRNLTSAGWSPRPAGGPAASGRRPPPPGTWGRPCWSSTAPAGRPD